MPQALHVPQQRNSTLQRHSGSEFPDGRMKMAAHEAQEQHQQWHAEERGENGKGGGIGHLSQIQIGPIHKAPSPRSPAKPKIQLTGMI